MVVRFFTGTLLTIGVFVTSISPVAALQTCQVADSETAEVLPGVVLSWESSFLCADAADSDSYDFSVTVSNDASSVESVTIQTLELVNTTPKPRGQSPDATGGAAGLPLTLAPGESGTFEVSGSYELVSTDEGDKVNLHFQAGGQGIESGEPFSLGINAHFRAPGVAAE